MTQPSTLSTFLWYPGTLGKAVAFYAKVFGKDFQMAGEYDFAADTDLMTAEFSILGHRITGMGYPGGPEFNYAISLSINCDGQDLVDYYWDALTSEGGKPGECGWLTDPFGVSWQVVPIQMHAYLTSSDPEVSGYAMQAMRKMKKLVIADMLRS